MKKVVKKIGDDDKKGKKWKVDGEFDKGLKNKKKKEEFKLKVFKLKGLLWYI